MNRLLWESYSDAYQVENEQQLNRWDVFGWGIWSVPEDEVRALGDVNGRSALELGCGACQTGIKVSFRGCNVVGLDFSIEQLLRGRRNQESAGVQFPLVLASADQLPFTAGSFDLVFSDHGAIAYTDPHRTVPELARVLRPGGMLVFNMSTPIIWMAWGDGSDPSPPNRVLRAPYFGLGRSQDPRWLTVEWQLTYGGWIRLFRESGLVVEDLIELQPGVDATSTYEYASLEWARDFPGEHIWKARKPG